MDGIAIGIDSLALHFEGFGMPFSKQVKSPTASMVIIVSKRPTTINSLYGFWFHAGTFPLTGKWLEIEYRR